MNGGLRYDYNAPPVSGNSYGLGTFYFQTGQYVFDQKNPITGAAPTIRPGGITPDRNNFAPRFGFAYQLTPRTVIRSSAGIFYDSFGSNYIQASQSAAGNWPFSTPQTASALNATTVTAQLPNPFPGNPVGSATTTGCSQCLNVDPASSRTPYVDEWTLSVQRQIGDDLGIEVAYFGSKGTKLTAQIVDNISPTPAPGSSPAANPNPRPFPQVSPYALNGYNEYGSSYNALAARVQRRYSHGLSFLLSYTYSKNIDYVDNLSSGNIYGQVTSNPTRYNYSITRGLAGFDERNVVSLSNVWDIPGTHQIPLGRRRHCGMGRVGHLQLPQRNAVLCLRWIRHPEYWHRQPDAPPNILTKSGTRQLPRRPLGHGSIQRHSKTRLRE